MREAIGGTWIFQIVIVFILLFTAFMCLSINRSKAFNVKDRIVQSIQTHNGFEIGSQADGSGSDKSAINEIVEYLSESAYRTIGKCPDSSYVGYSRDGKPSESNAAFCIAKINSSQKIMNNSCGGGSNCIEDELPEMSYYRVVVFYQLDLPIFHDLFNFNLVGETKMILGGEI